MGAITFSDRISSNSIPADFKICQVLGASGGQPNGRAAGREDGGWEDGGTGGLPNGRMAGREDGRMGGGGQPSGRTVGQEDGRATEREDGVVGKQGYPTTTHVVRRKPRVHARFSHDDAY